MKRQFIGMLIGILAMLSGQAQVPSTNDTSDAYFNTGMGTGALLSLSPTGSCQPDLLGNGCYNTASGAHALASNMTGSSNTASGAYALYSNLGDANTAIGFEALYYNTSGFANTAGGYLALLHNTTGDDNTAFGSYSLLANSSGLGNTAYGNYALNENTAGNFNTASGIAALQFNTTGDYNTASGASALASNKGGYYNTAAGFEALESNTGGYYNTATGSFALSANTSGESNTAAGFQALFSNTSGYFNTATGLAALYYNVTGTRNAADGAYALNANTTGAENAAFGHGALRSITIGNANIAVGFEAGHILTTGSYNIDIGNIGASSDNNTIRIGTEGQQAKTHIAGIYDNTSVVGIGVVIDSSGQLGTVSSSERFKTDIAPIGSGTEKLQQLRPVTFHYKTDTQGTLRYGLIAEEVAKVYPELVVRDKNGRIDGVQYDELAPMLLNELQKEHAVVATLVAQHESDAAKLALLEQRLASIQATVVKMQPRDDLVARQ